MEKTKIISNKKEKKTDVFIIYTSILSLVLAGLFLWKSFITSFTVIGWAVIGFNLLYVPVALIGGKRTFSFFYFAYSGFMIFATAFDKTYLYNNYTALFIVSIVVMLKPKLKWIALCFYFILVSIAFVLNEEKLVHYLIHVARSLWFIGIVEYVLNDKFRRKKLVLYQDERQILEQLSNGTVYQKEVVGFSENTIYRKLKAARERNGNLTREELVDLFRKEKEAKEEQD